jgi:hypothetical protein
MDTSTPTLFSEVEVALSTLLRWESRNWKIYTLILAKKGH